MLIPAINQFITHHNLIANHDTIIIGFSGGPDSLFLLHLLTTLRTQKNLKLIAAHLDHGWRSNSNEDVAWCAQVCAQLAIPFIHAHARDYEAKIKHTGSQEAFGRALRRLFLQDIAQQHTAQAIALAHHADDQQENFFIRLVRGSTLSGLCGMKPKNGLFIRPLLEIYKREILAYLHENKIAYLLDPSNESDSFLRNRIRTTVVPNLRTADERFDHNFARTLGFLQKAELFLEDLTEKTLKDISDDRQNIKIEAFLNLDPFVQYRVLMRWLIKHQVPFTPSEAFFDEMMRFICCQSAERHEIVFLWILKKQHGMLSISRASFPKEII